MVAAALVALDSGDDRSLSLVAKDAAPSAPGWGAAPATVMPTGRGAAGTPC
jgi:hypothetical protein